MYSNQDAFTHQHGSHVTVLSNLDHIQVINLYIDHLAALIAADGSRGSIRLSIHVYGLSLAYKV